MHSAQRICNVVQRLSLGKAFLDPKADLLVHLFKGGDPANDWEQSPHRIIVPGLRLFGNS